SFGLTLLRYATRIRHPHRNASSSSAQLYLVVCYRVLLKVVPLGSVPFVMIALFAVAVPGIGLNNAIRVEEGSGGVSEIAPDISEPVLGASCVKLSGYAVA
ncbi:MAG: hypothetical protein Q8N48_10150, partial [Thiobacillus sp.]|nr:hypothetical protein [Thiobacillus sp.]MDP2979173.1 hypothetical protein [Thiobacillus sp.]